MTVHRSVTMYVRDVFMVCKHQDKSLHLTWDKRALHFLVTYHQNLSFKSLCLAAHLKYLCGKLFPFKHSICAPS